MPIRAELTPGVRFLKNLNSSISIANFSTMKPNLTVKASRSIPILSRIFPHRLKYQSFSKRIGPLRLLAHQEELAVRRFSTRSSRPRSGFGEEVRATKSLIDDEAELSDWVGSLNSNSYFTRSNRDSDDESENRSSGRNVRRGRDETSGKRRRESGEFGRTTGGRDAFGSYSGNSTGKDSAWARGRNRDGSGRDGSGLSRGGNRQRRSAISDEDSVGDDKGLSFRGLVSEEETKEVGDYSENRNLGRNVRRGRDERGGMRKESYFGNYGVRKSGRPTRGRDSFSSYAKNSKLGNRTEQRDGGLTRGGKSREGIGLMMSDEDDDLVDDKGLSLRELVSDEGSEEDDDNDEYVLRKANSFNSIDPEENLPISSSSSSGKSDTYLSDTRFDQCAISPLSLKGIKDAGYEKMTVVQEATLPVILKGKDVLAKAKTGTGKTVAFLLPSIEVIVKSPPISRDQKRPPIYVLIICPTRELASQAAAEANTLLKYHHTMGVQVVIGGTRLALEQKRMQTNPCQILVATPGRLKDHIENTAGFATRLMSVKVLVLDEADHLLDMGFRRDIERIIAAVPKQRQTLLFSATVPEEVGQISHIALRRDHEFINTVQEGTEETHSQVKQTHLVAPLDKHFSLLYAILKEHAADNVDYKVIVFCTTAMVTKLVAELLSELNLNIREIHSRKAQTYRTRVSDEFRKSKGLILVTSDVSARGVDYPDVTLVVQVGLPADREQYIHRLGRTGRKGKEGLGILLLAPWEESFLSTIKDLPITKAPVPSVDPDTRKKVERALAHVEMKTKESAYQAWLGYYNSSKLVGRDKYRLVELANDFSRSMGLDNPPAIPKLVLGKMGLRNIPGLRSR